MCASIEVGLENVSYFEKWPHFMALMVLGPEGLHVEVSSFQMVLYTGLSGVGT